jgi:hypothetical protein
VADLGGTAGVSGTLSQDGHATAGRDLQLIALAMGRCQGRSMASDESVKRVDNEIERDSAAI